MTEQQKNEKRRALKEAAIAIIAEHGLENVTTKELTTVAKTGNEAYIYRLFQGKRHLLSEMFDLLDRELASAIIEHIDIMFDESVPLEERGRSFFSGVWHFVLSNPLDGIFTKEKDKSGKFYNFFMNVGDAKLIPTKSICEKVFACKGNKIFHIPLEYIVEAKDLHVALHSDDAQNVLVGNVTEILDYGHERYALIDVYGQKITAAYEGKAGDLVDVTVPVEAVTIKDKTIDIIIV